MLVKIFKKRGKGKASSCKACVDYLLNKPEDTAQILQGDPRLSQEIADNLLFQNTYTAGCLSFEEENLSDENKRAIMAEFEKSIFAGLEREQYNISWVQHIDKGRLELNFVIPNIELTSGKRLQPYYDKADRPLAENFKQVINYEYGLSDPNDPIKKQNMIAKQELPSNKKQALDAITDGLGTLAKAGKINDRQDVINALETAGFEIARITPKNISIKTDGQNLRLKGAFYEQDFRFSKELSADIRERAREYKRDSAERYQTAREKLNRAVEKRKQEFSRKYPNRASEIDKKYNQNVPITNNNSIINTLNNNHNISYSSLDSQREISRYAGLAEIITNSERNYGGGHTRQVPNQNRRDINLCENGQEIHQYSMGAEFNDFRYKQEQIIKELFNDDRNRNLFRESIKERIRTTRKREELFIERIREFTQRKFINKSTIQSNIDTIQRNNRIISELKEVIRKIEKVTKKMQDKSINSNFKKMKQ